MKSDEDLGEGGEMWPLRLSLMGLWGGQSSVWVWPQPRLPSLWMRWQEGASSSPLHPPPSSSPLTSYFIDNFPPIDPLSMASQTTYYSLNSLLNDYFVQGSMLNAGTTRASTTSLPSLFPFKGLSLVKEVERNPTAIQGHSHKQDSL